jgi:hypothetical protein
MWKITKKDCIAVEIERCPDEQKTEHIHAIERR